MTVSHLLFLPPALAPKIPPLTPPPRHLQPRHFLPTTSTPHLQFSIPFCFQNSPLSTQFTARNSGADGDGEFEHNQDLDKLSIGFVSQWVVFLRSVLPGGPWWNLRDSCEEQTDDVKSISIISALWRIWALIADDKWVVFAAFASLAVAAGSGALINLLMLSQPLALSSLAICFVLSAIFLVYGLYQKEAAKVTHDLEACANEVAYEAFSLVRTIRAYGVEKEETVRYKQWLKKLIFVNVRESLAYGLWTMSFNTLYRSTQILAVLFGGLSIIAGHMSPEQLTKYILYCEWLIYATWRLIDNLTSLLQSVGASERVFQWVDLLPSSQFSCKGVKLQQLRGDIEFVDVSFCYPTRVQALVLQHVNMSIRSSEVIAIVGPSGSGKSTLVKLLLRLFDPTDGEVNCMLHC